LVWSQKDLLLLLLLLLLTAVGLMPGDSVYKDKVHEHPQYNTVHMSTVQVHEHYKTQETENTIQGTINRIQDTKHRKTTVYTETTKHEHKEKLLPGLWTCS
jgi:hypothetical protein